MNTLNNNIFLTTRDIVTIAILSSLGGALSTFVGYLGNLINLALGVPFGAGQFMAGLHVFWVVLMRVLVPRTGVGTAGGLLKGLVELFTGSTHGIVIVIVSMIQGIIVDIGALASGNPSKAGVSVRIVWWLSAGVASASNVIVFQLFYFANAPILYISIISLLAFCSGVIFAGYFAWETIEFLNETGVVSREIISIRPVIQSNRRFLIRNLPAIAFVLFLSLGSIFYLTAVTSFTDPQSCNVTGLVETPYKLRQGLFTDQLVTIEAELIGAYTQLPPTNYTGVLVSTILAHAKPYSEAIGVRVIARDGYQITLELEAAMNDDRLLLSETSDGFWLIAAEYDGSYWVRQVTTLEVY